MTHEENSLERLTADLLQARDAAQVTRRPSQRDSDFTLERAYEVGRCLQASLMGRGYRPVGRKIGFTNPAMWGQFRVSQPIWAPMYAQTVHYARNGRARLNLDGMVAPRLEPEVVLKLRQPVPSGEPLAEDLAPCIEWAAIGFEVVDSHYADWSFTAAEAVADFGVHAALVVGTPWRVDAEKPHDLASILPALQVALRGGKEFVAAGEGRNALGSPLLALGFLARVLAAQAWAPPLVPGEIVTTGTLTALPFLRRGESYCVEVAGAPLTPLQLELDA
jgi:2-oxo-3-hexenedioate decarboxylase